MDWKNTFAVVTATTLTASFAGAAIIPVSSVSGVAQDRNLFVATAGGSASLGNASGTALNAGETGPNTNSSKAYVPFTLSAGDIADITSSGATATLRIVASVATNPTAYTLSLFGLPGQGADPVAVAGDYGSAGTLLQSGITPAVQAYSFDVTSYVAAQAASNSVVAFRLELDGITLPNTNALTDGLTFVSGDNAATANRPTLSIVVPEPATLMSGAAIALGAGRRRRIV